MKGKKEMKGILGRKAGMTQVFIDDGKAIPVTVVEVKPNTVLEVKTEEKHGYSSVKLGYEDKKDNKANKAELGIAKKANTSAKYFIKEIRNFEGDYKLGDTIDASIFEAGEYVDVTGISKGKGFQGSIKRHNQTRGPMTHGSKSHRVTGSLGDIRGTVKKTKKMPGHMGHEQVTQQNLVVIAVDLENNVILVKGSIPGAKGSYVILEK
jgi:large subunit ribosomal protein L3